MTHKMRLAPGMSIHTGAEYVYAPPGRRGQILRQCVEATKSFSSAYMQVEQFLHTVAHGGGLDLTRLSQVRARLESSRMTAEKKALAQQAVDAAERNLVSLTLPSGIRLVSWRERHIIRPIAEVELRARPFALLVNEADDRIVGAMMVRFKKQHFEGRSGQLAADLLRRAIEAYVGYEAAPDHCIVLDAFADQTYFAPKKTKRLRQECEDAMYDLAGAWRVRTAA